MDIKLWEHQQQGLDFLIKNNGIGALFWDVGIGKTLTALKAYEHFKSKDNNLKLLIFCPCSLILGAWGEDIAKYTDFVFCNLRNGEKVNNPDIYIINYERIIKQKIFNEIVQLLKNHNFMCILDESQRIKTPTAKRTKQILKLKNLIKYKIILTATPATNGEQEYWSQMSFVNNNIFHEKYFMFKNKYFALSRGKNYIEDIRLSRFEMQEMYKKGWQYRLIDSKKDLFYQSMKPYVNIVKSKDVDISLPEQIYQTRYIELSTNQRQLYEQMKAIRIIEINRQEIPAQNALTKILKLTQISSNFIIDENSIEHKIDNKNNKITELKDILQDFGNEQCIIWANFHREIEEIKEALGDKACCLYGPVYDKDKVREEFKSGKYQYLVAHPKSAGVGLTFINCRLQVFYSLSHSLEDYIQACGRTHRGGQKRNCVYIFIIARNTIEQDIKKKLENKESLYNIIDCFKLRGRND